MQFESGSCLPAPSAARIARFEAAQRVTLPEAFKNFLAHSNGGAPIENHFLHEGEEREVETFLCLLDNARADPEHGWNDLSVVITQLGSRIAEDEDQLGAKIVPFAKVSVGDFLCLDFRQSSAHPTVGLWEDERSDDFQPHVEEVAGSFEQFLAMLHREPEAGES